MLRTLLLLTLFCLAPNLGQTASTGTPAGPRVELPETIYEFPPVPEGVPVVHDFVIFNRGDQPLDILKVKAG
ncbi:MAG: hypothetical protein ACD_75C00599G0002 [uncultured bacterium]|nr:MAG: hypothetical protein ACD_75C00599G0002 [uncultured bacterium]HBG18709.1 hypothetical protein [Desulfobulbaceae bacterium]